MMQTAAKQLSLSQHKPYLAEEENLEGLDVELSEEEAAAQTGNATPQGGEPEEDPKEIKAKLAFVKRWYLCRGMEETSLRALIRILDAENAPETWKSLDAIFEIAREISKHLGEDAFGVKRKSKPLKNRQGKYLQIVRAPTDWSTPNEFPQNHLKRFDDLSKVMRSWEKTFGAQELDSMEVFELAVEEDARYKTLVDRHVRTRTTMLETLRWLIRHPDQIPEGFSMIEHPKTFFKLIRSPQVIEQKGSTETIPYGYCADPDSSKAKQVEFLMNQDLPLEEISRILTHLPPEEVPTFLLGKVWVRETPEEQRVLNFVRSALAVDLPFPAIVQALNGKVFPSCRGEDWTEDLVKQVLEEAEAFNTP